MATSRRKVSWQRLLMHSERVWRSMPVTFSATGSSVGQSSAVWQVESVKQLVQPSSSVRSHRSRYSAIVSNYARTQLTALELPVQVGVNRVAPARDWETVRLHEETAEHIVWDQLACNC